MADSTPSRCRSHCLIAAAALAAAMPIAAVAQQFVPLGDLAGGVVQSRSRSISPEGSVIVGSSESTNGSEAFRAFYGGIPIALGDFSGGTFSSESLGVSRNGAVVVGYGTTATGREAFRWNSQDGMLPLGALPADGSDSVAYAVNTDGTVIVGQFQKNFNGTPPPLPAILPFRWTLLGGVEPLTLAAGMDSGPASNASARGVSSDGTVIVGFGSDASFNSRPFRWTQATGMVDIGAGVTSAQALGCSPDGSVVVGRTLGTGGQAFVWTQADGLKLIGMLPGHSSSAALDSSFNGGERLCGVHTLIGGGTTAAIWDRNVVTGGDPATGWRAVRDILVNAGINMTGWTLTQAYSMCDDGQIIVGQGTDPSGNTAGWAAFIAIPPPPPCPADFNGSGGVSVQDIFDFLEAYFSDDERADFNRSGGVSVQDIFDFLGAYFEGC